MIATVKRTFNLVDQFVDDSEDGDGNGDGTTVCLNLLYNICLLLNGKGSVTMAAFDT